MALFKTRATQPSPEPDDTGFTDESVDSLRQRARRRLIGSAILVLLAVIGFPLVFDHEPRPVAPMDVRIEIPNRDQTPSGTPVKPTPAPAVAEASTSSPAAPGAVADAEPAPSPVAGSTASAQPAPPVAAAAPEPTPAVAEKPAPAKSADRFVIQIGAFADADKVKEVRGKLDKAGLKPYIQTIKTAEGPRTRVRVGPFTNEDEARKTLERVKALNLQAQMIKL